MRAGEWCGRAERRFRFSFFGQRDVVGGSASKTIRRLQQQNRTEKSASQAAGKGRGAGRFQTRTESRHVALFSRLSGPASQSSYFFYFSAIGPHSLTLSLSLSHSVFLRLTLSLSLSLTFGLKAPFYWAFNGFDLHFSSFARFSVSTEPKLALIGSDRTPLCWSGLERTPSSNLDNTSLLESS